MKRMTRVLACVLAATALVAIEGCAYLKPVQPWEKGTLARKDMLLDGDPLEMRFGEHIYASREAASGGAGVGGGGCGCN